jgi:hypothetical protein
LTGDPLVYSGKGLLEAEEGFQVKKLNLTVNGQICSGFIFKENRKALKSANMRLFSWHRSGKVKSRQEQAGVVPALIRLPFTLNSSKPTFQLFKPNA